MLFKVLIVLRLYFFYEVFFSTFGKHLFAKETKMFSYSYGHVSTNYYYVLFRRFYRLTTLNLFPLFSH